jgi:hypothetical protein
MSFWSAVGPEPKRNYRWVVFFNNNSTDSLSQISYALKKVNKPKGAFKEASHAYLNHKFYYPGRFVWEPVSRPDANYLVNKVMLNAGYGVPTTDALSGNQVATPGKRKFAGALGNTIDISQLDADGNITETWSLYRPFFTNIVFGDGLSYDNEDIVEITCNVRYDWAQLIVGDKNSSNNQETEHPIPTGPSPFPS